jgi:glucosyl-dolichyl phosphate glucuronosyltransferase
MGNLMTQSVEQEREKLEITIVICTFNRANYLKKALLSFFQQSISQNRYKILVVDNNSKDNTKDIVFGLQGVFPNIDYIYEPNQGLSNARNTGIKYSQTDLIAFMDDDAVASKNWLEAVIDSFNNNSDIGYVGGNIDLNWESKRPDWLSDRLLGFLGFLNLGTNERYLKENEFVFGGNLAIRKSRIGNLRFNHLLGIVGKKIGSNEEIEFQIKARILNIPGFFNPNMLIVHSAKKENINKMWYLKRLFSQGVSDYYLLSHENCSFLKERIKKLVQIIIKPDKLDYPRIIFISHQVGIVWAYFSQKNCISRILTAIKKRGK